MRILLVEDDLNQNNNLVKIIERNFADIKVYPALNIKTAEKLLLEKEFDLFFVDINLGDGSGLDFAKKIRTISKYELTGIIFITTQKIHIIEAFKDTHCYDFLIKPYNIDEIFNIIRTFTKNSSKEIEKEGNYYIVPLESGASAKIYEEDIVFVEYSHRICNIYTNKNILRSKALTLTSIIQGSKSKTLIKSHKSYLVNTKYIEKIEKVYSKLWDVCFSITPHRAQLSSSYKDEVFDIWGGQ